MGMSDIKHVVLIHGMCGRGDYLAPARTAFEERDYTVHIPTLRHHELPLEEGATKIGSLSLRDYADDLVKLVDSLDSAALLVGHSMGALLAQLVAGRTRHAGVVAACPSPAAGIYATSPMLLRLGLRHFLQPRPWAKPMYPLTWEQFRKSTANAQTEEHARELFAGLVCDSGRVMCEVGLPWLDRAKAATVNYSAITTPVLVIAGECDRILLPRIARQTASRYQQATYVEIPRSDHMVFSGKALAVTMGHIDDWIARNHLLTTA
jgi:pimeloyl-ACP methyl ester carboxylesterase